MQTTTISVRLPENIGRAVDGEARRLRQSRAQVVANLIVEALPRRLAEDLSVIDADVVDETAELSP